MALGKFEKQLLVMWLLIAAVIIICITGYLEARQYNLSSGKAIILNIIERIRYEKALQVKYAMVVFAVVVAGSLLIWFLDSRKR